MDKKRIALIFIFVLISLVIGYFMYRLFFAEEAGLVPRVPPPTTEKPPTGEFPPSGIGVPAKPGEVPTEGLPPAITVPGAGVTGAGAIQLENHFVQSKIVSPSIDKTGNANFYNQNDGKFYRVNKDGATTALSDQVFYNVNKVTWSPNNSESIIEYPDGNNIYYNFQTKKQTTLPQHWEDFSFSPEGARIAAKSIALSPENRWIVTSNPDGGDIQFIESMGENAHKVSVDWSPTRKVVALSQTGDSLGADRQQILLIGQNHENFKALIVEGRGFQSQWSPDGQQLLYSVYSARNDYKPELWIVNADGDNIDSNRRPIQINTWAEKCAFASERFVYCGVPVTLDAGAGFRPDIANSTQDQIYKIDLQNGSKTIVKTDAAHVIDTIFVNPDNTKLFFTDKTQSGLFDLSI